MTDLTGKVVVLTGAASGIGRSLAQALSREGAIVEMADKNEAGLLETRQLMDEGADTILRPMDVSSLDEWESWAADITLRRGHADIVINNAGVALTAHAKDMSYADFEWLMGINFWGVVYGTRTFLPQMVERDNGHIVNVSSIFGLFGVRGQSAYCAAKFAVRGYSEAVRMELDGTGVHMTVVHPGGIKTNIARNARHRLQGEGAPSLEEFVKRFEAMTPTTADGAAKVIIDGIRKNNPRVRIGPDARLIDRMTRLFPVSFPLRVARRGRMKMD